MKKNEKGKRMKKHLFWIAIVVMLGMVLSLVGCAQKTAEPGTETGEETGEEPGEVIELTFAHPFPATHHHHVDIILPFVEEIKEASNGRINIAVHPGCSITTGTTAIDDVSTGAVDMIWTLQGYTAGRFPLTEMLEFF